MAGGGGGWDGLGDGGEWNGLHATDLSIVPPEKIGGKVQGWETSAGTKSKNLQTPAKRRMKAFSELP